MLDFTLHDYLKEIQDDNIMFLSICDTMFDYLYKIYNAWVQDKRNLRYLDDRNFQFSMIPSVDNKIIKRLRSSHCGATNNTSECFDYRYKIKNKILVSYEFETWHYKHEAVYNYPSGTYNYDKRWDYLNGIVVAFCGLDERGEFIEKYDGKHKYHGSSSYEFTIPSENAKEMSFEEFKKKYYYDFHKGINIKGDIE